jgi:hypothetical protein
MAVSRYDQRKSYEEAEANAIGTEFVRADLLPAEDATRARELLNQYANQRIAFYLARGEANVEAKLQSELWSAVAHVTRSQPTSQLHKTTLSGASKSNGFAIADHGSYTHD